VVGQGQDFASCSGFMRAAMLISKDIVVCNVRQCPAKQDGVVLRASLFMVGMGLYWWCQHDQLCASPVCFTCMLRAHWAL
jgi:hypothetical protein